MLKHKSSRAFSLLTAASLPHLDSVIEARAALDELRLPPARVVTSTSSHEARKGGIFIIHSDLTKDTTLYRDRLYVVDGEVHVRAGVTLTIEDGATILIRNGLKPRRSIDTSALIFDSGSGLRAGTVTFASADEAGARVAQPNNGGVFFCGSYKSGTKDGVSSACRFTSSDFRAERIILDHVGRPDPREGDGNDNDRDDIDAISLIGVGPNEWNVKGIESHASGDDGFDAYNSVISVDTLIITNPTEDGVNLTSSRVTVRCYCAIDMSHSTAPDRELFDFELDHGRCRFVLEPHTLVKFSGYWGGEADDVRLKSLEMPRPPALGTPNSSYEFVGTLSKRATVYSSSSD
jgi:hypothetical protein